MICWELHAQVVLYAEEGGDMCYIASRLDPLGHHLLGARTTCGGMRVHPVRGLVHIQGKGMCLWSPEVGEYWAVSVCRVGTSLFQRCPHRSRSRDLQTIPRRSTRRCVRVCEERRASRVLDKKFRSVRAMLGGSCGVCGHVEHEAGIPNRNVYYRVLNRCTAMESGEFEVTLKWYLLGQWGLVFHRRFSRVAGGVGAEET
jgi:hypothetical protein